jgi:uncharacterized surface protein with fasciclin (FAS1) repeats
MTNQTFPWSKRFIVGVASVGIAALVSACGGASDTTANPDISQDPTVTEPPPANYDPSTANDTVVDVAANNDDFSTLVQAIEAAELTDALATSGPITVFAPTNEAFEALPEGTLEELLKPENKDLLRQVLSYHVLQQEVTTATATTGEVPTAAGRPLSLTVDEATGEVMVNEARVIEADIVASNGVIHAVDQVILPPDAAL